MTENRMEKEYFYPEDKQRDKKRTCAWPGFANFGFPCVKYTLGAQWVPPNDVLHHGGIQRHWCEGDNSAGIDHAKSSKDLMSNLVECVSSCGLSSVHDKNLAAAGQF